MDRKNEPRVMSGVDVDASDDQEDITTILATSVEAVPVTVDIDGNDEYQQQYYTIRPITADANSLRKGGGGGGGSGDDNDDAFHEEGGFDCLLCGDTTIYRLNPGRNKTNLFMSLCGNSYMDLRHSISMTSSQNKDSVLENDHHPVTEQEQEQQLVYNITSVRLCGDIRMLVPPGTIIRVRRVLLCGNRDIRIDDVDEATIRAAKVTVNILILCGNIIVRSNERDLE
jgi:hypothetical protein